SITGTLAVSDGGTGATTLDNLISLGQHTTGNYVATVTAGDGLATSGTNTESASHTLSINAKTGGGLVIENTKLAVDLSASSITGTLAVSDGGTGATTLDNLISLGQHTTGNYVATVTAGNGLATTGANTENAAHTLSIDAKLGGGLVIEDTKLAVDLGASSITGTLAVSDGGTGATTLDNLISLGQHTTGNFVATVTAGNGLATTGANTENASHTLSIDAKLGGGIVIENTKLALDLGASSITGTLAVSDGGTGATTLDNLITLGNHTVGNYVATVTAGNGLATTGSDTENAAHTLSIDAKLGGGLVIEDSKLAVDLGASFITGTLAVSDGGTGATTLDNLISLGQHTTGNFVATVTAGDGLATTGANIENSAHTLSINAKTGGGLVIENTKLALDLGASSITGTLAVSDGGTGATTLDNLITLGNHTTGNYVATVTAGNGLSTTGSDIENAAHTLSIDAKLGGGLIIEDSKLAVDLGATSITGTLAVSDGGTGATTLDNLIALGQHTTGDFVATITAGDGLATTGSDIENSAHTLSIDTKADGGLVIQNSKLALDLGASDITGVLDIANGGTGTDTFTTDTIPPGTSNKFIVNNTITGDIVVSGNILPSVTETFSLGSANYKWDSLYVAANTINIGNTKLSSSDDGGLAMNIIKFE
ncbi:hypothetical protein EB151_08915, partial [archaeon]|nr:hypothetical protein [archaeon]